MTLYVVDNYINYLATLPGFQFAFVREHPITRYLVGSIFKHAHGLVFYTGMPSSDVLSMVPTAQGYFMEIFGLENISDYVK